MLGLTFEITYYLIFMFLQDIGQCFNLHVIVCVTNK